MKRFAMVMAAVLVAASGSAATGPVIQSVDAAFEDFWAAPTPAAAVPPARRIVAAGASFEDVWGRLRRGPDYAADAPTGRLLFSRQTADGGEYPYMVVVPDGYDAAREYPVRVYLHGGVNRDRRDGDGTWWRSPERVVDDRHIAVFPYSWNESLWWQADQVENLSEILWRLKRAYNVDDNNVHMFGVSDGATGAWFFAFRDTTPWAGFLPFIGHPSVLSNPRVGADGDLYVSNLRNKSFYVVNGGHDRLYPVDRVQPFMTLFERAQVPVRFVPKPESEHNTRWWPEEAENIEAFIAATPRLPYPDRLWWRTDRLDRYNRAHWVVIEDIDPRSVNLAEANSVVVGGQSYIAFPRRRPSGRLRVERRANEVEVQAEGVRRFRLLLSPDQFDLERPIRVVTNGVESFNGRVEPDVATLLKWAASDGDREMLFAAELPIDVAR